MIALAVACIKSHEMARSGMVPERAKPTEADRKKFLEIQEQFNKLLGFKKGHSFTVISTFVSK